MSYLKNIFFNNINIFLGQISNILSFTISTILLFLNLYFLTVEDRGIYALIYTLPSLLIIATDFGITPIVIRYVSRNINLDFLLPSLLFIHIFRCLLTMFVGGIVIVFFGEILFNVENILLYLALPIIFSLSANSYLTPYFYGKNKISAYYIFLIFPNFCILILTGLLILFNSFNIYNIVYCSLFIYILHSIVVLILFVKYSKTHNFNYNKQFNQIFHESKFLYVSNLLSFGFIYVLPIIFNIKFGITNLSYILFCIALSDKLFLIGDSVGYEIIRKINLDINETINIKFSYFKKVLRFISPVIILSSFFIFFVTKYILLEFIFVKYKPVLPFFLLILLQYFFQSFQRIYSQFYNGLGKTYITFFINSLSVSLKVIFLLLSTLDIYTSLTILTIIDFFILLAFLYYSSIIKQSNTVCQ